MRRRHVYSNNIKISTYGYETVHSLQITKTRVKKTERQTQMIADDKPKQRNTNHSGTKHHSPIRQHSVDDGSIDDSEE